MILFWSQLSSILIEADAARGQQNENRSIPPHYISKLLFTNCLLMGR